MQIENETLLKKAFVDGISLFLGAGFSIEAKSKLHSEFIFPTANLPLGAGLKNELLAHFKMAELAGLGLPQISQILVSRQKNEFYRYLQARFHVGEYDQRYLSVRNLNIRNIFTTNIDDLVPNIYANFTLRYLHDVSKHGNLASEDSAVLYYPLHGRRDSEKLTFTPTEISTAFSNSPEDWYYVRRQLEKGDSLFWGFSLDDADVLQALNFEAPRPNAGKRWIVLYKPSDAAKAYFKSMAFLVIEAETSEMLEFVSGLTSVPASNTSQTVLPLPQQVPNPSQIVSLPIFDFFLGAAPTWSFVSSPQIHIVSLFTSIENAIQNGENCLIVGIPLSGKTTLLMQLAYWLHKSKPFVFYDAITEEQAKNIVKLLAGSPAIVFVDNFLDSLDAVRHLIKSSIQVIGSERSYRFESISFVFSANQLKLFELSDLGPEDVQAIFASIPDSIRKQNFVETASENTSAFEVIDGNVAQGGIRKRLMSVLADMQKNYVHAFEALIVLCYVFECRINITYDILFVTLRKPKKHFSDIYDIIEQLKNLIKEFDDVADPHQEYFKARSSALAEAVLECCDHKAFREIYEHFHNVVSPMVIPRYDIFRRYAYDDNFTVRAFPKWQDGVRFYNKIVSQTTNPYDWQNGALYLNRRKRYKEAFQWIDTALNKGGSRIFSIKNSHAKILFDANIGLAPSDDPLVRETLDLSMRKLSGLYKEDRRKNYHITRFSEQALAYFKAYGDDQSLEYLKQARKWLNEQIKREQWNRRLRFFEQRISRAIGSGGT